MIDGVRSLYSATTAGDAATGRLSGEDFAILLLDVDESLIVRAGSRVTPEGLTMGIPHLIDLCLRDLLGAALGPVARLVEAAAAGRPNETTLRFPWKGGDRLVAVSLLPKMSRKGEFGSVLTLRDVTARQAMIAELKTLQRRIGVIDGCEPEAAEHDGAPPSSSIQVDKPAPWRESLSRRQHDVLGLLLRGKTNQEISDALGIALPTTKYHVQGILRTAGVRSRTELALLRLGGAPT